MAEMPDIKVTVEAAIHGGFRKAIQEIADEYGVFIDEVRVTWIETSSAFEDKRTASIRSLTETSHS